MKRILFFLMFLAGSVEAAPSAAHVRAALNQVVQMQATISALENFLTQVDILARNGYAYTVPRSTNTVTITQAQLQDITDNYQALKVQLTSQVEALP